MADDSDTPSLSEVLRLCFEESILDVRVSMPATVVDYDPERRTVTLTPSVGRYILNPLTAAEVAEHIPQLVDVPVEWSGGGGAEMSFPLKEGDPGMVVFADSSLDEWKRAASGRVFASDVRTHHLADGVFRPGARSPNSGRAAPRNDAAVFGYATAPTGGTHAVHVTPDGISLGEPSAAFAVAKAEAVEAALNQLKQAFAFWVPVPMDGGLALKTVLAAYGISTPPVGPPPNPPPEPIEGLPNPPLAWPPTVGSTTVKVKG